MWIAVLKDGLKVLTKEPKQWAGKRTMFESTVAALSKRFISLDRRTMWTRILPAYAD